MFNTHLSNIFSFITFPTLMCVSVYTEQPRLLPRVFCNVHFIYSNTDEINSLVLHSQRSLTETSNSESRTHYVETIFIKIKLFASVLPTTPNLDT